MKIKSYTPKASFHQCIWEERNKAGEYEERTQKFKENPLESLDKAMQELVLIIGKIEEVPASWLETVKVTDLHVIRTQAGVRSMQLGYTKGYKINKVESRKTPFFRIDPPDENEDKIPRHIDLEEAKLCIAAIVKIEEYINGDRQEQTTIEGADPEEGTELFD